MILLFLMATADIYMTSLLPFHIISCLFTAFHSPVMAAAVADLDNIRAFVN